MQTCADHADVAVNPGSCLEGWICADLSQLGHQWDRTQGHIYKPDGDTPQWDTDE